MLEILSYSFIQRALIAGTLIAVCAPLVGIFLVVRKSSALADTLAHTSLIGIAISSIYSLNTAITATITAIIGSTLINKLRQNKYLYSDSILVFFISGSLAVSSILFSIAKVNLSNVAAYLFGNISTITVENLYFSIGVLCLSVLVVAGNYKDLVITSFDEDIAKVDGINTKRLNLILMILAALIIAAGIQIVGVLLIGALMIIPVLSSLQYKLGFLKSLLISIFISTGSVWIGIFLSFYLNTAAGSTIVLINILVFVISLFVNHS